MTATGTLATSFSSYTTDTLPTGPIVVASDASAESDAAFPLAHALARHTGADVKVLSILPPIVIPTYMFDTLATPRVGDEEVRAVRQVEITRQLQRLVSPDTQWPIVVQEGDATSDIVEFAHTERARVVLTGRGRHALFQRIVGGESVIRMLQLGDAPVYAVESGAISLARRVVIAIDFTEFSRYAARVTLDFIAPNADVHLVHVGPDFNAIDPVLGARSDEYRAKVVQGFVELRERIARDGVTFHEHFLSGNPSDQLLHFVHSVDADLVALATHGFGFLRRMIVGSVATSLIRNAKCSVLCVPGSARTLAAAQTATARTAAHAARPVSLTRTLPHDQLDGELIAFGVRNVGRPCTIEVDRADIGAQILCHDLPLVAATYDRIDHIASIMVGASHFAGAHLTHSLGHVVSAEIMTDADDKDRVLRLSTATGQTLVTLL